MSHQKIAVIGMSCWYPGARNLREFWENLVAKRQQFRRTLDARLPLDGYGASDKKAPDKTYGVESAYLEDFDFDWMSHRVPKSAVEQTDIVHWLALEVALRCMEDAGYSRERLKASNTGVVLGNSLTGEWSRSNGLRMRWPFVEKVLKQTASSSGFNPAMFDQYLQLVEQSFKSVFPEIGEDFLSGSLSNTVAGRICNYLDLHGGGYTIDGACSSSLLAVINGAQRLINGEIDLAFVGGVDISLDTFELIGFAKTGALTAEEMLVYDERSSGFIPGEGCGFTLLKRYEDALRDGDQIYATLNGWGISSDGKGGLTAPSVRGQRDALNRAYQMAGYPAREVNFFEGHGTGTRVGDKVELSAIAEAVGAEAAPRSIAVTSLKSLVGHTKAAAGVGAFIKAVMGVNQRVIPPVCGTEQPNQLFSDSCRALYPLLSAKICDPASELKAGVSAMGFGGINSHVTLSSAGEPSAKLRSPLGLQQLKHHWDKAELFVLSASSGKSLVEQVQWLADEGALVSRAELADLAAHMSGLARAEDALRAALVAKSPADLVRKALLLKTMLEQGLGLGQEKTDEPNQIWVANRVNKPRLGFLFPGQGSQQVNMSAQLLGRSAGGQALLEQVNQLVGAAGGDQVNLSQALLRDDWVHLNSEEQKAAAGQLASTDLAQPAIVLSSLLWLDQLEHLGIKGQRVLGHSLGELTSLYYSGVISRDQLLAMAAKRGALMRQLSQGEGSMLMLRCSAEIAETLLKDIPGTLVLANKNSSQQTIVSGDLTAVAALETLAQRQNIECRQLNVSGAFHSPLMIEAAEAFRAEFAALRGQPQQAQLVCSGTGELLQEELSAGEHIAGLITRQVDFVTASREFVQGLDLVLEVGPGRVLSGLLQQNTQNGLVCLPTEASANDATSFKQLLGRLFVYGHAIHWPALYQSRAIKTYKAFALRRFIENPCERPLQIPVADLRASTQAIAPTQAAASSVTQAIAQMQAVAAAQHSTRQAGLAAPVSGAEAVQPVAASIESGLLQLLAQVTGYDVETLSLDMKLLDDLNMDSIKSGEYCAAIAKRFGITADVEWSQYLNASLGELAALVKQLAPEQVAPAAAALFSQSQQPGQTAAESAPAQATGGGAQGQEVMELVALITGYDKSTLALDMTLLDDLNMDSIKVGELIAQMVKQFGIAQPQDPSSLANASLAQLQALLGAQPAIQQAAAPIARVSQPKIATPGWTRAFRETWVKAPLATQPNSATAAPLLILSSQPQGLGSTLVEACKAAGVDALLTPIDKHSHLALEAFGGLVLLNDLPFLEDGEAQLQQQLNQLSQLANQLLPRLGKQQPLILLEPQSQCGYSWRAFFDSVKQEEQRPVRYLQVQGDAQVLAQTLVQELLQGTEPGVNYSADGERQCLEFSALNGADLSPAEVGWSAEDVLLVTGGAKGITAECAFTYTENFPGKLVLLGSSQFDPNQLDSDSAREIARWLDAHRARGYSCDYLSCNLADADSVAGAMDWVRKNLGEVTGVIHGAGINKPRLARQVNSEQAAAEIGPKLKGMLNLYQQCQAQRLKLLVAITSIIGVTGMSGNAWYAFSNQAVAALVNRHAQAYPDCLSRSLAYSVWDEIGMGAKLGSVEKLAQVGVDAIPRLEGLAHFTRALQVQLPGANQELVIAGRMGNFPVWNQRQRLAASAMLSQPLYFMPGVELVARRNLSLERDPYLLDHNFKGSFLFPTVFGLEAMAEAALQVAGRAGDCQVQIRNIQLSKPITVLRGMETDIEIFAQAMEPTAGEPMRIRCGILCEQSGMKQPHFSAEFSFVDNRDAPKFKGKLSDKPLALDIKRQLYNNILFQGERFQRLDKVLRVVRSGVGEGQCQFSARLDQGEVKAQGYCLGDPYFRDVLLQSVQLVIPEDLSLPVAIGSLDIYSTQASGSYRCVTHLRERQGDFYIADVEVLDEQQRLLQRIGNYRLKILEEGRQVDLPYTIEAVNVAS